MMPLEPTADHGATTVALSAELVEAVDARARAAGVSRQAAVEQRLRRAFAGGYDDLVDRSAAVVLIDDTTTSVANLDAVIASKEAADREKDRRSLPYLQALAEERGDVG